jgi:hypothetical protein
LEKILNQFKIFNCLLATSSIFQVFAEKVTSEDGNGQGALHARKKMEASLLLSRDQLGVHGTQYDNTMILILLLTCIYFFSDFRVFAGRNSSIINIEVCVIPVSS